MEDSTPWIRSGHGRYCGQIERYRGEEADIREYLGHLECKFENPKTGMHLNWHPFGKGEFVWDRINGSKFRV